LAARSGDQDLARRELDRIAADGFAALPKDINWFPAMSLMGEAIALIGDTERAESVYGEMLPYEGLVIVIARAAGCNGPVDRVLGLLARTLGRPELAERHLRTPAEIATRMGDRPGMPP